MTLPPAKLNAPPPDRAPFYSRLLMSPQSSCLDQRVDLNPYQVDPLSRQQIIAILHALLMALTGFSYEMKMDDSSLLFHHADKRARALLLHDMILSALFGLASSYGIETIQIEQYGSIQVSSGLSYVSSRLQSI